MCVAGSKPGLGALDDAAAAVGKRKRRRGQVDQPRLRHRCANLVVGVPAAAGEEARLEVVRAEPREVTTDARRRIAAGGPRVRGRGPVRVQPERAPRASGRARARARSSSPCSESGGRTSAATRNPPGGSSRRRRNRAQTSSSSSRSTWQETTAARTAPYASAPMGRRSAYLVLAAAAALPRLAALLAERQRHHRRVRRQGRRLRADLPRERDVRVHPGDPVGVHAAALRLLPDPALLGARPATGS